MHTLGAHVKRDLPRGINITCPTADEGLLSGINIMRQLAEPRASFFLNLPGLQSQATLPISKD